MSKPDTSERAKKLAMGQNLPLAEPTASPAEIAAAEEDRVVMFYTGENSTRREKAPGETPDMTDKLNATMVKLIETGIAKIDQSTNTVDWPDRPADNSGTRVKVEEMKAAKAKTEKQLKPAKKAAPKAKVAAKKAVKAK